MKLHKTKSKIDQWRLLQLTKVIILHFLFHQILISMGVDDLMAAKNMVMRAIQTTELNRIDYQTFNSLQRVENNQVEARYNALLQRVGTTVSFDADLVSQFFLNVTSLVSRDIECLNRGLCLFVNRFHPCSNYTNI